MEQKHENSWLALAIICGLMSLRGLASCSSAVTLGTQLTGSVDDGNVVVQLEDGSPFATLHLKNARVPYIWPLVGPSGDELTRAFPMDETREDEQQDHPHHRSLWFSHGSINGHDFWLDSTCRIALEDEGPSVRWVGGRFELEVTLPLAWLATDGTRLLSEDRDYRFGLRDGLRLVECESVLTADHDVVFGDTKEGTFALRVRPELRLEGKVAAGTILNSAGQVDGECWGERAAWVSYEAPFQGRRVGLTVMDHSANLRHPSWWHARDYGLVASNPFGIDAFEKTGKKEPGTGDFKLAKGDSLRLRHLVVLSRGNDEGQRTLSKGELAGLWDWWVKAPLSPGEQ